MPTNDGRVTPRPSRIRPWTTSTAHCAANNGKIRSDSNNLAPGSGTNPPSGDKSAKNGNATNVVAGRSRIAALENTPTAMTVMGTAALSPATVASATGRAQAAKVIHRKRTPGRDALEPA